MTGEAIFYLSNGDLDSLFQMQNINVEEIIIAIRKSEHKKEVINAFLFKMKDIFPSFCLDIIYDMEEYADVTREILDKMNNILPQKYLVCLLNGSPLGPYYLDKNLDQILKIYYDDLDVIFRCIINNQQRYANIILKLLSYNDMNIRYLFMDYLIKKQVEINGITNYFYNGNTLMPEEYVSTLAVSALMSKNKSLFEEIKAFVLNNYKYNTLAEKLLCGNFDMNTFSISINEEGIKEFESDADTYFSTANTWRLQILEKYSKNVSIELLQSFKKYLLLFEKDGNLDSLFEHLDIYGLTRLLEEYVDKYLSISHDKTREFIGSGTTASCYRIGDYTFKLIKTKWSYENVICPNLYLILPNLEEYFIRTKTGVVKAGIEVQKYLKRDAKKVPREVFKLFKEELNNLGYYSTDTFIDGECGDNTRMLDSYLDASSNVPEWFKEYPLVLVDRDRVYRLENKFPKQRSCGGY